MKYIPLLLGSASLLLLAGACTEREYVDTTSPDDIPRILSPSFPDRSDGNLPTFQTLSRDDKFSMKLKVTPAKYVSVHWLFDGLDLGEGPEFSTQLPAGTYNLKILVTTHRGLQTSREGIVQVKPLPDDPQCSTKSVERYVAPGFPAKLFGSNLQAVSQIIINDIPIPVSFDQAAQALSYTLPDDMPQGRFRVLLVGADNEQFGAECVNVVASPLVTSGFKRTKALAQWSLSGLNLQDVSSLTLGDTPITSFISKSPTEIVLTTPDLPDGSYTLSGTSPSGPLAFLVNDEFSLTPQADIASEILLWEGNQTVDYNKPDGHPDKHLALDHALFQNVIPGSTLSTDFVLNHHSNHTLRFSYLRSYDVIEGTSKYKPNADGTQDIILTKQILDRIAQEDFVIWGYGVDIRRVYVH